MFFQSFFKVIEHLAVNNINVNFSTQVRNEMNQHVISKIMKINHEKLSCNNLLGF